MNERFKVVVTGATGMVGEGVLHECLKHPGIEKVLFVGRKSCGVQHEKLTEVMLGDFLNPEQIANQLFNYDACLFCLGVSSLGMKEEEYKKLTYLLTTGFAKTFLKTNPGSSFVYVSGAGTDSSERGKSMWARIKGQTENELLSMGFRQAYMFRPGYIQPAAGMKFTIPMYRYVKWSYPFLRKAFPKYVSALEEIGLAMIHCIRNGYQKNILEVSDINDAAAREHQWLRNPIIPEKTIEDVNNEESRSGILPDRDLKKNLGCG
ncbi:MAG: hypothetical protein RL161_357 [Bacteroidota bacterium]|jgi:hypothetical protein